MASKKKEKKKEWEFGKGWKGSAKAAMDHHPEKFSIEACKHPVKGKLCPYALMASMKKKGYESHYKDQKSTLKGKPKKKKAYKEWSEWLEQRDPLWREDS